MKEKTKQIKKILKNHAHWLKRDCEGWENMRANLHNADLRGANLRWADLRYADLHGADLTETDLSDADLCGAELVDANLCCANLSCADLRRADLSNANLCIADLRDADLREAKLDRANLHHANLYGAKLDEDEKIRRGIKLKESLIGWKKCQDECQNEVMVKLEIPKGSIVFSINNSKCRTDKAKVLEIEGATVAHPKYSKYNNKFIYRIGDELEVFDFDCQYNVECSSGIHFFRTKEEAEKY